MSPKRAVFSKTFPKAENRNAINSKPVKAMMDNHRADKTTTCYNKSFVIRFVWKKCLTICLTI